MQTGSTDIEPPAPDGKAEKSAPVWHRPAWVTAMVGVISAFLTVPQVVGDYLAKEQEIEATRIENEGSVQSQALELVENTLSQQGDERIFMLRYFAATLKDDEARKWAEAEVIRLEEAIAASKAFRALEIERSYVLGQVSESSQENPDLMAKVRELERELAVKGNEVEALRRAAGVVAIDQAQSRGLPWPPSLDLHYIWSLSLEWDTLPGDVDKVFVSEPAAG